MKKIHAMALAMIMTTANATAKSPYYTTNHEVGVAVGTGAFTEIVSSLAEMTEIAASAVITTTATGGMVTAYYTYGDEKNIPSLSAEYFYHVNKVVGWGGMVVFNGLNRDMYINWHDNVSGIYHKEKSGTAKFRNLSIIPNVKVDWLRRRCFGLYSKAGLGLTILHESQKDDVEGGTDYSSTSVIPNFQWSPIGIETGSQRVRAYVEFGLGEQGMALAGLKYKF